MFSKETLHMQFAITRKSNGILLSNESYTEGKKVGTIYLVDTFGIFVLFFFYQTPPELQNHWNLPHR